MTRPSTFFATTLCLLLGTAAFAQDTAAPAPDAPTADAPAAAAPAVDGLSMGTDAVDVDGIGSSYTEATFGTWQQRCVRTEDGADPCDLYKLIQDSDGNNVAEFSLFGLPAGQQAAAGATIIVPIETLLTAGLVMSVDNGKPRSYPYAWCTSTSCVSRIGFTQAEIDSFKKGNEAKITIVPAVAPEEKVELVIPLTGFTAGYDAVNKSNGN
jgi:invasion protein IalB